MTGDYSEPLVSVIIPLYNSSKYIEDCIDSVLSQDYPNIEVIVVDDGSTDEGASLVGHYKNVKLIRQTNQGVTAARKAGVMASKGEWIMFVDADDTVRKEIISSWLPLLRDDVDIIIGKMHSEKTVGSEQMAYDILEHRSFPKPPWLKLFRRYLFENNGIFEIPRDIVWGEDVLMLIRLAMVSKGKVAYSKARNYEYRRHPEQITKTFRVTSGYEEKYHKLLIESIPKSRMSRHLMNGSIRFRLHLFERILRDCKYTHDDFRRSVWFKNLRQDISDNCYRPSLWFRMLLRYGNGDNIRSLRSVKWIFKTLNAF